MKRKHYFGIALLLAACGGMYAFKEYNRKPADLSKIRADKEITAQELINRFEQDEAKANTEFFSKKNYIVEVSGTVQEIKKDESGFITLAVSAENSLSAVRCSMDNKYADRLGAVKEGQSISIKGAVTGFNKDEMGIGSDVILNRCVIAYN